METLRPYWKTEATSYSIHLGRSPDIYGRPGIASCLQRSIRVSLKVKSRHSRKRHRSEKTDGWSTRLRGGMVLA